MKNRIILGLAASTAGMPLHAAPIDFEAPAYSSATALTAGPATNILTDRPFNGQDGWSQSTSSNVGGVVAAPVSGSHSPGQVLRAGSTGTYIGAKSGYTLVDPTTKQFTFDLQYVSTTLATLGLWNDADSDGLFDQTEAQIQFGNVTAAGNPFGYRATGFSATVVSSGVVGVTGNWYRFVVTIGDPDGVGDRIVTMRVLNLTTGGTEIDFDAATFGPQPWVVTVPLANFGPAAPADCEGVFVRTTSTTSVDNINGPVPPAVPTYAGWDGGASPNGNWTTALNWMGDTAPAAGNLLVFGDSPLTSATNNFAAGTSFAGLDFTTAAGDYTLSGNRITLTGPVTNAGGFQTLALPITLSGNCAFGGNGGVVNLDGAVDGTGALIKSGSHTLQLNAAATHSGGTTITAGSVFTNAAERLPNTGALVLSGGSLDIADYNETVGAVSLTGPGNITGNTGVLTGSSYSVSHASGTATLSAILGGSGSITKTGAGTLSLSGANTYSGGTVLEGGITVAGNNSGFGSNPVVLGVAGTDSRIQLGNGVTVANGLTLNLQPGVTGRGLLEVAGTATATWSGAITSMGIPTAGGTFFTEPGANLTLTGPVNGEPFTQRNGQVTYSGGGNATAATLSGTTTVGAENGFPATAVVTLGGSAIHTFNLNGHSQSLAGLVRGVNAATITNNGATPSVLTLTTPDSRIYSGAVENGSGGVSLVMQGTGRQTLGGANGYTGTTTVTAGTLAGTGAAGSAYTVATGGTLAPGNVIGSMSTATSNFSGGSSLEVEIGNWTGSTPGTDWDLINASALVLTATPANKLTVKLVPSSLQNFAEANRSFVIATGTTPVSGFDAAAIQIDSSAMPTTGIWTVQIDGSGNGLQLVYAAGAGSSFATWATANAGGQGPDLDFDHDGVPNGVEYFMGETGSSFTANPALIDRKVTWPKDPSANATYVVETSTNLKAEVAPGDGGWAPAGLGVVDTGTSVEYTIPAGSIRRFARLKVTTP